MADEFHTTGNWWDSSRSRFESGTSSSSSSSSTQNTMGSFAAWLTEPVSASASTGSLGGESGGSSLVDPNLHMMNLGLSSQAMDWNQSLLRGDKSEGGFRSMLQENLNSNPSFQEESATGSSSQIQWRDQRIGDQASSNEFKQFSHGFDQMDSTMYSTPANILQGILGTSSESHHHHPHPHPHQQQHSSFDSRSLSSTSTSSSVNYPGFVTNYGLNPNELLPSWSSNKAPQFLRISPPKQHPHGHQLHFANNAPFWNAASPATVSDVRPNFFSTSQMHQFATPTFEEKPKQNLGEAPSDPAGTVLKKSGNETTGKRARNEAPTPLPAFKVRKEKMGDRITALQQLVAPFGKTDTASVLHEVIEYIKFLHQQVAALTTQYMKTGATFQHQQNPEKSKEGEGPKQDLRTRGLCLVPISSIYPMPPESPVDFWAPAFGGTFR